ncbi:MAG: tartrate dehydrogenase [Rhodospirillaceae bacterium]|nr:tartrate dehydrogenase [Alphaproteobacteria bacterium]MBR73239.1 tartrate dehydrogenase [Rhodospirillaceae bacterium]|tara:strand:- start:331 stop:1386 length:1056 start_codon:yes stop_codon:yes gene_type:complete
MSVHRIAAIPGDGIGKEVLPEAISAVEKAGSKFGASFKWENFDWSCEVYSKTGYMMPKDGIDLLKPFDSIFLGAVGFPGVPDHISLWGLLIPIRRAFQQYVNVRPIKLLPGVTTPLSDRNPEDIDFIIVRENNEGEYSEMGGRIYEGTDQEMVIQESVFSRFGVDRALHYAFKIAQKRGKTLTSATKSNGIIHTMPYWDERFDEIKKSYPDIETNQFHIDILSAHFVQHPDWFDVVVGSNLFGDILSDLGAAVAGGMGLAPAGNINPDKNFPSMFEPVHGSAPDIAGKGIANPIAQIWTGAMMLEHLGLYESAESLENAIVKVLSSGEIKTQDLGGKASTSEMGKAIIDAI